MINLLGWMFHERLRGGVAIFGDAICAFDPLPRDQGGDELAQPKIVESKNLDRSLDLSERGPGKFVAMPRDSWCAVH